MISAKHTASLRDPAGYLVKCENQLIRVIKPEFANEYRKLLTGSWLNDQCQAGTIAAFRFLSTDEAVSLVGIEAANCLCLDHTIISFPSYPSEWPLEMLCAAAELTLNLCVLSLRQGIGLKDATPFNILFQGTSPIFIDLLSFQPRDLHDPTWLAHGQFVRNFLFPTILDSRYGMSCHKHFLTRRDGIEPEEVYRLLSPLARLSSPFLGNVTMPILFSALADRQFGKLYTPKRLSNADQVEFILQSLFARIANTIQSSFQRKHPKSIWSSYNDTCTYTSDDASLKTAFVEQFFKESRPKRVLDIGCNTGQFSFLAASYGANVVATDLDPEVVGSLWQHAKKEKANILPLVVNIAWPTPALGWRNRETLSFLERAEGYFDVVLMLAVCHHLLVTDQIPLDEIITLASKLTKKWLLIEYVGPEDLQFKRLVRGRDALYSWFNRDVFERELGKHFEIIRQIKVTNEGRWLYLAKLSDHE